MFHVVATAIVEKDGKYLIARRSLDEEKFPGRWTVPGGTLDREDLEACAPNEVGVRYEVLEGCIRREVREEVGLGIGPLGYLVSLAYPKRAGPALCISLWAPHESGEVRLSEELIDHAWVTLEEAKGYDLIPGILAELFQLEDVLAGRRRSWEEYERLEAEGKS